MQESARTNDLVPGFLGQLKPWWIWYNLSSFLLLVAMHLLLLAMHLLLLANLYIIMQKNMSNLKTCSQARNETELTALAFSKRHRELSPCNLWGASQSRNLASLCVMNEISHDFTLCLNHLCLDLFVLFLKLFPLVFSCFSHSGPHTHTPRPPSKEPAGEKLPWAMEVTAKRDKDKILA